jgi:uncharacterized membrane protein YccC
MLDRLPEDKVDGFPIYAEPPARKYSPATIVAALVTLALLLGAMVSAVYGWNVWLTIGLGVGAVVGFLVSKLLERKDRSQYGADRDSFAYKMKGRDWGMRG